MCRQTDLLIGQQKQIKLLMWKRVGHTLDMVNVTKNFRLRNENILVTEHGAVLDTIHLYHIRSIL